ncbi:DUF2169 domain-containing protein [Polyangium aurulentum]|nr:DUF2169 domain-containing protein [Polyangium aurulentum]
MGVDATGMLPNLQSPQSPRAPTSFGPIAADRPARRRLGELADPRALASPTPELPDGFDFRYYHPAPQDQQLYGYLQGNEWILLDGFRVGTPRPSRTLLAQPYVEQGLREHIDGPVAAPEEVLAARVDVRRGLGY